MAWVALTNTFVVKGMRKFKSIDVVSMRDVVQAETFPRK